MSFEKIEALGVVKRYTRTEEGIKVSFKDLLFPDASRDTLDFWMDSEIRVRVVMQTYQDGLRMDAGTDAEATDGK